MTNKFRNPVNNSRYLKHLFFETTGSESKDAVLYTLKDVDHKGYPSLYRLYMAMDDLTEYEFACKYFDGWEHWLMLCECTWFKPYVARWRQEMDLRTKARFLKGIKAEASSGSRNALAAMKYLVERGWEPKKVQPKTDKAAVKAEAERMLREEDTLMDQAERLGITVVK